MTGQRGLNRNLRSIRIPDFPDQDFVGITIVLEPLFSNDPSNSNRDLGTFRIHGPSKDPAKRENSSEGCIIMGPVDLHLPNELGRSSVFNKLFTTIFLSACGLISVVDAEAGAQILPPSPGLPYGSLSEEIDKRHLNIGLVVIGVTSIEELLEGFGKSSVAKGDAGSPALICYYSVKDKKPTTIIFEGWSADKTVPIIGFTLQTGKIRHVKSGRAFAKCSPSAFASSKVKTKSGLRLGIGLKDVIEILGPPLHQSPGKIYYAYSSKSPVPISEQEGLPTEYSDVPLMYEAISTIEISMDDERVSSINIRKIETF